MTQKQKVWTIAEELAFIASEQRRLAEEREARIAAIRAESAAALALIDEDIQAYIADEVRGHHNPVVRPDEFDAEYTAWKREMGLDTPLAREQFISVFDIYGF